MSKLKIENIRMATIDELKKWSWQAQEEQNKYNIDRINKRYNEIMKYDY